jgi:hypothetical protein
VIRNPRLHEELDERERWERLRRMTPEESIAVGEALLTSELMELAVFPDDDHPCSRALSLGITPEKLRRSPIRGGE